MDEEENLEFEDNTKKQKIALETKNKRWHF